ncbi:hypothetical protein B0H19DRAFT_1145974 [Mycena capillaripes]|nr:hypothetical protein B0H19DRAFT_1145974 [Mycena capillaripes]
MLALSPSPSSMAPVELSTASASSFIGDEWCCEDEPDLRRFVLKRNSLEKAIECVLMAQSDNSDSMVEYSSIKTLANSHPPEPEVPIFTAIDYSAVAPTPSSPPVSPLSQKPIRSALKRTTSPAVPPKFRRTASILDIPTLSHVELPAARLARASIDSVSSSSSSSSKRSRRSSISSISSVGSTDTTTSTDSESSTTTKKSRFRLRAIPRFLATVAAATMLALDNALGLGPTPEEMLTIAPIPLMRDKPYKPNCIPMEFTSLAPGEKRTRFLAPVPKPRDYGSVMWADMVHVPDV